MKKIYGLLKSVKFRLDIHTAYAIMTACP